MADNSAAKSRHTNGRPLRLRGLTSLIVTFSFGVTILSAAVLYIAPRGRTADWSGWTCIGLWREQWVASHIVIGTLFVVAGAVHLVLNWRPLYSYVLGRGRQGLRRWRELLLASGVMLGLWAAAVWQIPPAEQLVRWSEQAKDAWGESLPQAPFPHAELLTLEELAARTGTPAERLVAALKESGLTVEQPAESLLGIAVRNGTSPAAIYADLRERIAGLDQIERPRRGAGRFRGEGIR